MAKGIANGFPMGAVVTTAGERVSQGTLTVRHWWLHFAPAEIAQTMTKALHFNTFGGNPMATVVASAVIDVRVLCACVCLL